MHKDSYCYLTLTIICSYCSTLLSLSIASKISYLNLQDSERKVHYLLTPHIALLNVFEQPAHLPTDIFKYSIKIGQESTPIQINTQLNEGFALNSQSILIHVLASRHSVEIRTVTRVWEWTVYKREEGRLLYGGAMAEVWQEMLLPVQLSREGEPYYMDEWGRQWHLVILTCISKQA